MPVTDPRNPFGVPQTAPENPGFQRTRQLAGQPQNPYMSMLEFERAAPYVQANQGLAYLQGIQNHQNEIAQQAQNLRIQQEAQLAAEQATQGLAGANPQSAGWIPQRQQILQQNPNAMLDPRFQNALRIYDQGYSQFDHQRQLQQRQIDAENKQLQGLMLRGMEYGGDEEKLTKFAQARDLGGMAQVVGEARRANLGKSKTGEDKVDYRVKGLFDKYASALAGGNPEEAKAISDYAREQGLHWENPVSPTVGAVAAPAQATSQTGSQLREVLGGGSPTATPEEIKKELDAHIGSPDADENFYSNYISNPVIPLESKKVALDKFREFVAKPVKNSTLTLPQVFARKDALNKQLVEAEENVRFHPEQEKFYKAWDQSKKELDSYIGGLAESLGVPKENVVNSLIAGDKLDINGRDSDRGGVSIPQLIAEYAASQGALPPNSLPHQIWATENAHLAPFKKSPFASRLGTKVGPVPIRQTWGDVLDAYVQDHKSPSVGEQSVSGLPRPSSPEEAAKLPPGTKFIDPKGQIKEVPALK